MFRKQKTGQRRVSQAPELPVGTFIETEAGYFYVYSKIKRVPVSPRVLTSWAPHAVARIAESSPVLKPLKVSGRMKFRNGSLIQSQSNGKMYLVSEFKIRHIQNPDWLEWLGFTREDAVWVSDEELEIHSLGGPLV